ncbi:MAG: DcaP family trimeric outer membrane transporter [candidate division Zixibacteria bacterium]
MKEFAIKRHVFLLLAVGSMNLVLLLPIGAASAELPPESDAALLSDANVVSFAEIRELQEILAEQDLQLSAQQELIDSQQEEIEKQRTLLQSVQAQLDRLAANQTVDRSQENAERPQQSMGLDELVAAEPESTRFGDDFSGSIPIPGSDAAVKIGGFVKMSMVDTLDPLGSDDRFVVGFIPVGDSDSIAKDGEVKVSANQSRLGIEIRDSTSYGPLRAFVEGDFAGSGDTYRLRHAFGQFRHVLAGKTWSTMVDNRATPEEIDFEGINGRIQVRQPQIRYFPKFGRDMDFLIGLEDPAPDVAGGQGVSQYPDIVVSIRRNWSKRWHVKSSLLLRQIEAQWDLDNLVTDTTFGWGFSVSGKVGLGISDERDNIMFQFNYGDGIGRYINDLQEVGGQDAEFDPLTGELETLKVFSGYVAYQHWWRESLRSTLTYSWVDVDNLDFQDGSAYTKTDRAIINLLWSPVTRVDVGAELLWGQRENFDGNDGTARQIQIGAKYRF